MGAPRGSALAALGLMAVRARGVDAEGWCLPAALMVRAQEWGLRVSPGAFQFSLRDHPRSQAGLQLARVNGRLHAASRAWERGEKAAR